MKKHAGVKELDINTWARNALIRSARCPVLQSGFVTWRLGDPGVTGVSLLSTPGMGDRLACSQASPKLRLVRRATSGLTWAFAGLAG
jgi:hypothetical protein